MKLKLEQQDDIGLITLSGEISDSDSDLLRDRILEHIESGGHDVILNLAAVQSVDSKALETLLSLNEMIAERLGRLVIGEISEAVERILHVTRLQEQLETARSTQQALQTIKGAA